MYLFQKDNKQATWANYWNTIYLCWNIFFIQYEKFIDFGLYSITSHSYSDSGEEDPDYVVEFENDSEGEEEKEEEEDEESEQGEEFNYSNQEGKLNEPYESDPNSSSECQEDEEFCREDCNCRLCFYFKDIVELVSEKRCKTL
jgi:hypothetical protein